MYPITSAVKALYDAEQRQVLRIGGTDKNGATVSITDADVVLGGFSIDRYSCNGEKLEVGTAIAAEMTLKLDNHNGTYNGIVFEGTELFVEVGIADWTQDNPTVNWMPCGYFTPDQQPRTANQITIHALDRMVEFDVSVDVSAITLPTTVAGLVGQVCTLCGVTLADDISAYTNASVAITALPTVQNMTYRNLIQWCAGVMATNAWFDWNGELRCSWYENATGYGMTTANRFSSDYYEDDLTITGAAYTNSSGVEIVEGTDDYTIDLTGNALVGPLVATVLPAINTKVNGFTYRPLTASVINAPYLWPMDVVSYTDKGGNTYSSALTNVAYGLNGATALESKGMTYAINAKRQPSGVTKELAQIISEAVERVETDIDESLTQQEIFNRLTDNGAAQGMVLYNGQLYVNASYINAGELSANRISGGTLTLGGDDNGNGAISLLDENGNVIGTINNDGIDMLVSNGHFYINKALRNHTVITGRRAFRLEQTVSSKSVKTDIDNGKIVVTDRHDNVVSDSDRAITLDPDGISVEGFGEVFDPDAAEGVYTFAPQTLRISNSDITFTPKADSGFPRWFSLGADELRYLGRVSLGTPLPVGSGGTGADNAADARANLGITPANIGAVAKTGDTMTGNLTIKKTTPAVSFYNSNGSTWAAIVYEVVDSGGNNRLAFAVRKDGSAGQEVYFLPVPDAHAAQTNYGLLTTKNPVTVTQGGTGGTSAAEARDNLGVPYSKYVDDATWEDLWTNCLSRLSTAQPCGVFLLGASAASVLSNGKISDVLPAIVVRGGNNSNRSFRIMAMSSGGANQYSWQITGATSSGRTTGTVYRYAGTAI